ncbi:protease inhibitor I9 family protein [Heyndrickxia sp. NPDC080065]|uniref:protease inhibitor I9 family protein n=1 Tax=Heyndrickxia sp. NPDC080065 TaxID=3390568 RepID=UPI003D038EF5
MNLKDHKDVTERQKKEGEEVMKSALYIDPKIDMNSEKTISIIIHFKTQPAKAAVALAEAKGVPLTLEKAKIDVEESHARFQEDLKRLLDQKHIPYAITYTYTTAFNGVSMKLPGTAIKTLLQSKEIDAIYANKEYHLEPPLKPM